MVSFNCAVVKVRRTVVSPVVTDSATTVTGSSANTVAMDFRLGIARFVNHFARSTRSSVDTPIPFVVASIFPVTGSMSGNIPVQIA